MSGRGRDSQGHSSEPEPRRPRGERATPSVESLSVPPGQVCETCKRRVPHPRTDKSPASRTFSVKLPADDHDSLRTMVDDLANGAFRLHKYPRAAAVEAGLVLLSHLQPGTLVQIAREMRGQE